MSSLEAGSRKKRRHFTEINEKYEIYGKSLKLNLVKYNGTKINNFIVVKYQCWFNIKTILAYLHQELYKIYFLKI